MPDPLKIYPGKDCEKVRRTHRKRGKAAVCNISTAAHDRTYQCVKKRTRGSRKVSPFSDPQNKKIRNHCHYTGLYREPPHNNFNLKYRIPHHIRIVFHNLSGYDTHLFIKELGKRFSKNYIGVIAENKAKYISFNVKANVKLAGVSNKEGTEVCKNIQLRFIDSCRFMASSLDKFSCNLCGTSEFSVISVETIWN